MLFLIKILSIVHQKKTVVKIEVRGRMHVATRERHEKKN